MTWRSKNIVYLILSSLSIHKHYEVISIGTNKYYGNATIVVNYFIFYQRKTKFDILCYTLIFLRKYFVC